MRGKSEKIDIIHFAESSGLSCWEAEKKFCYPSIRFGKEDTLTILLSAWDRSRDSAAKRNLSNHMMRTKYISKYKDCLYIFNKNWFRPLLCWSSFSFCKISRFLLLKPASCRSKLICHTQMTFPLSSSFCCFDTMGSNTSTILRIAQYLSQGIAPNLAASS